MEDVSRAKTARPGARHTPEPEEIGGIPIHRDRQSEVRQECPTRRQKTVLCVDDEPNILSALRRTLRSLPYRVVTTTSAEDAIRLAGQENPDLIILDVMMPGMDGFETLKRLRALPMHHDTPVVMLTGRQSVHDVVKGYEEGVVYYITKPCRNDTVINVVQYLIGGLSDEERAELEHKL